jgi:hypothetical protein
MIKNVLAALSLSLVGGISAVAQFQKGDRLLGVSFGISSGKQEQEGNTNGESKQFSSSFFFNYGFATNDNTVWGGFIAPNYSSISSDGLNSNKQTTKGLGASAGMFVRKYKNLGKNFYLLGQGDFSVGYTSQKTTYQTPAQPKTTGKQTNITLSISPAISYLYNNKWFFELQFQNLANLGYSYSRNKIENPGFAPIITSNSNFGLNSSMSLGALQNYGVGIKWLIPAKKNKTS